MDDLDSFDIVTLFGNDWVDMHDHIVLIKRSIEQMDRHTWHLSNAFRVLHLLEGYLVENNFEVEEIEL